MIILIPCKSVSAGKSRLSGCLDAARRRSLCKYLLTRTVELAIALVGSNRVCVVTSDSTAVAIAASRSVSTLADAGGGLNPALDDARNELGLKRRSMRLMILPIDLPYASLDALSEAMDTKADVVINPDEKGRGTNLLVSSAADQFPFLFGADSCGAHSSAARACGLRLHIMNDWRLARDIDEPDEYLAWTRSSSFPAHLLATERLEPLDRSTAPT